MKQIITILFTAALLPSVSFAQKEKITFGIRAGLNFTSANIKDFSGLNYGDNSIKTGINAGFYADVPLSEKEFFQPAILFSSKGTISKGSIVKTTISSGYIEVPLNFLYKSRGSKGGFVIGGGPYLAYGVSGTVKERTNGYRELAIKFKKLSGVVQNDAKNVYYLKPFDAGINAVIGVEGKSGISFQISGQIGFINQSLQSTTLNLKATDYTNYGLGLSFGYRF